MVEHLNTQADPFGFTAGQLSLDFINTQEGRRDNPADESLNGYRDLAAWGAQAGVLSPDQAERLIQESERQPEEAARVLKRAIDLREALHRIFSAVMIESQPTAADLALLNVELSRAMKHARLLPQPEGFAWGWEDADQHLDPVLWAVARSAAELLTSPDRHRVGVCSGDSCGWLFMDTTKNHSRRWCDMKSCGNRAKVRRHRQRKPG